VALALSVLLSAVLSVNVSHAEEVLPKHITPETLKAVRQGLDYLARTQGSDGAYHQTQGGEAYPVAMTALAGMAFLAHGDTPTRGRYAPQLDSCIAYLLDCTTPSGLITSPGEELGRPMYGHGFSLMFLASVYGATSKESVRNRMKPMIENAVTLTARGQSRAGGWYYTPGSGDEGSVTITQIQALRAAHNAGFTVPPAVIEASVRYIDRCGTPEGGIAYSLGSGGGPRLAISCAACATLYNAGEYDAPIAERCLNYIWPFFKDGRFNIGGFDHYAQLYASQAFYLAGDKYWDVYFPPIRDDLIKIQDADGSWNGGGVGKTYGTSVCLIMLQLPYKYLPVYQR
jgi:hypothetical protein